MRGELVLIDWGTTNFRAQLLDSNSEVLASFVTDRGVGKLDRDGMVHQMEEISERWGQCSPRVFACGMIGSGIGWLEMPYLQCAAGASELAGASVLTDIGGAMLRLLPGVKHRNAIGGWDVMRGEELQAVGWAALQPEPRSAGGLCVMPGTHSKWIRMSTGRIEEFFTSMTGEIFAALRTHGLLRHHVTEEVAAGDAFLQGVEIGRNEQGLGRHLFSIRGNCLLDGMSRADASAFASGLLIGAEIADGLRLYAWDGSAGPVHIVGAEKLVELYRVALEQFDIRSVGLDSQRAAISGFRAIDRELELSDD